MAQPQYLDLQNNGYGGVDFNSEELTVESMHKACQLLKDDGNAGILATIITEHLDVMAQRITAIVKFREQDPLIREMVAGIHVEGPFINPEPGYRGAHPVDAIQPAQPDLMKRLIEAGDGLVKLVTLAPECDAGLACTKMLAKQKIVVSAGHSNPSLEQLEAALDAGLLMYTHLGNGCPMQMHRHDNIVQRVLSLSDRIYASFIADGVHVAYPALRNYLKLMGDHAVLVSDAMAAAGLGPGRYRISRWDLLIGEDLVARAPDGSHLVGCAISLPACVANVVKHLGLTQAEADRLAVDTPRAVLAAACAAVMTRHANAAASVAPDRS